MSKGHVLFGTIFPTISFSVIFVVINLLQKLQEYYVTYLSKGHPNHEIKKIIFLLLRRKNKNLNIANCLKYYSQTEKTPVFLEGK
jgi:hypothetical protein